jgi:hypothetical protein
VVEHPGVQISQPGEWVVHDLPPISNSKLISEGARIAPWLEKNPDEASRIELDQESSRAAESAAGVV